MTAPRVFISYSHDSPEHVQAVLGLSERLRADGIDTILDQYLSGAPSQGWPRWLNEQIQGADAVLLVCSHGFERLAFEEAGRGVRWEGSLLFQELYSDKLAPTRFIPVVFAKSDIKFIPEALRAYTFYVLDTDTGIRDLIGRLIEQAAVIRPALGVARNLAAPPIRNLHGIAVFLCHCSEDKPAVRDLYLSLGSDGAQPWLDEEDLLPGQAWRDEIPKAVRAADAIVVCLSLAAVNRAGYFQKEIKFALDALDHQPEGSIYLIPAKLEDCSVPERIGHLHWVDLQGEKGYDKLKKSLLARAKQLRLDEVA